MRSRASQAASRRIRLGRRRRVGREQRGEPRRGLIAERVYIDPDEFPRWCAARGLDLDADARMAFASEAVARKYGNLG